MLIGIAIFTVLQSAATNSLDYTGLPILTAPSPYRIVTESVEVQIGADPKIGPDGTATISSTTVYRNQGGDGTATLLIPQRRDSHGTAVSPNLSIVATWDGKPIQPRQTTPTSKLGPNQMFSLNGDLTFDVSLKSQATHVLRVTAKTDIQKVGYNSNQLKSGYLLDGDHPIDLFTMAYRYADGVVYRQPAAQPPLGWQIGAKGASLRKPNFTPAKQIASIQFYPYGFGPIGQ